MISGRTALLLALLLAAPGLAQEPERAPLPIGAAAEASASDEAPATFSFTATESGLLAVTVVGASEEHDLFVETFDEDQQALDEGTADRDRHGHKGKEYLAVVLPEPGTYLVRVSSRGEGPAGFTIGAAFAPAPGFADPDPDRRPSKAAPVTIGKPAEDTLGGQDRWDWFAVRCEAEGTLTVLTKATDGDLKLEVFAEGNYAEDVARSDADLQDKAGNESVSFEVQPGQTFYVRVTVLQSEGALPYRLITALIPN